MMLFQGLFMARANHGFRISRCRCRPSFRKTRRQTLCDKLDNVWVLKKRHPPLNRSLRFLRPENNNVK